VEIERKTVRREAGVLIVGGGIDERAEILRRGPRTVLVAEGNLPVRQGTANDKEEGE
jgi:hypothetical protein